MYRIWSVDTVRPVLPMRTSDTQSGVDSARISSSISHGDVVDLNQKNIRGYDVREIYVKLVANMKRRAMGVLWRETENVEHIEGHSEVHQEI